MRKWLVLAITAFVVVMIVYRVVTHGEAEPVKSIEQIQAEQGIPVEVMPVKRMSLRQTYNFTGTLEGVAQADAIAEMSQELLKIYVSVGQKVKKGDSLAELDTRSASNMMLRYDQSRISFEETQTDLQRMKALLDAGAISPQEYERAERRFQIAQSNMLSAKKVIKIPSPISGTVTHIYYKVGESVRQNSPVVRVARLNPMRLEIAINESVIAHIHAGQTAEVTVAAYPERKFAGVVERVSLSADPLTRTFNGWVKVDNPDDLLRPGMFAKVKVFTEQQDQALTIPKEAVIRQDDQTLVFTVTSDSLAEMKTVNLGIADGNLLEVTSGLTEAELVVVNGHNNLTPGAKVKVVP